MLRTWIEDSRMSFKYPLLPSFPTKEDLRTLTPWVHSLLQKGFSVILERAQRDPTYPWLDMKFSPIDGRDFSKDDPIRGKGRVYSWIQGRGLEALAEYYWYGLKYELFEQGSSEADLILQVVEKVSSALWKGWQKQGGHLFFTLSLSNWEEKGPEGRGLKGVPEPTLKGGDDSNSVSKDPGELYTYSDIFCSRGLYAAALALENESVKEKARAYCIDVLDAVWEGRIYNDQVSFDPKNPITPVPGRKSHAPYMLMIPTVALLCRFERQNRRKNRWFEEGLRLIEYVLEHHVNLPGKSTTRFPELAPYDFLEYLDTEGNPYVTRLQNEECILCDPGHALEFVGLSTAFLKGRKDLSTALSTMGESLYRVFQRNLQNGFQEKLGGIVKLFDLRNRRPVNPDMPWWSLPETMRAAWECRTWGEEAQCMRALACCWNSLVQHYIGENPGDFCIQNRNSEGNISVTIPAVPDVDPLYHTGLPLLTVWGDKSLTGE